MEYQSAVDNLLNFPVFARWHEMRTIRPRAGASRPRDWQLPLIACQAAGGSPETAIPDSAALVCAQISIILVDDMLDDDRVGNITASGAAEPRTWHSRSSPQVWTH